MISKIKKIAASNESLSLMANFSVAIFGFLSFMLLARSYSQEDFGIWLLYIISGGLIEMLRFAITKISIIKFLSGATQEEHKSLIGANWLLGMLLTLLIVIIIVLIRLIFPELVSDSGYSLFFTWYPLLAVLNLPYNNALGVLQAGMQFKSILVIRMISTGGFFVFVVINFFFLKSDILMLVYAHLAINFMTSLVSMLNKWDGISFLFHATKNDIKRLFHFGKFTIGTLLGSNLLKSADTILIGLSAFGPAAVALYSVPLKLTEIMEIPLRSFIATAFPKMSKASSMQDDETVRKIFYTYAGALTIAFVPMVLVCIFFAKLFVLILGGEQYAMDWLAVLLFQIFAVYTIFLPIDKFTGVALDSINKPKKNFYKIILMVVLNVVGDLIALFVFQSIIAVALVTIVFTIAGLAVGFKFLNQEIPIRYLEIFKHGIAFYQDAAKHLRTSKTAG
jgi:O-antigen/teichoic acid export membrane protein